MEQYFNPDIITNILNHLDKDTSFHLLNITKFLKPLKKVLYGKYLFNHHKIDNLGIAEHIKYLKTADLSEIHWFSQLHSLNIFCNDDDTGQYSSLHKADTLDDQMSKIPNTLHTLVIGCEWFDKPLNFLPNNLKSLTIKSEIFNQPINHFPESLEHFDISKSYIFNQPFAYLPKELKSLSLHDYREPFENFPNSLTLLSTSLGSYRRPIKGFPDTIKVMSIEHHLFTNECILPLSLEKLILIFCGTINLNKQNLPDGLNTIKVNDDTFNKPFTDLFTL